MSITVSGCATETVDDIVDQTVGRALDLLDVPLPGVRRWHGLGVE